MWVCLHSEQDICRPRECEIPVLSDATRPNFAEEGVGGDVTWSLRDEPEAILLIS